MITEKLRNIPSRKLAQITIGTGVLIGVLLTLLVKFDFADKDLHSFLDRWIVFTGMFFTQTFNQQHTKRLTLTSLITAALASMMITWSNTSNFIATATTCTAAYALSCFHKTYHQQNSFALISYKTFFQNVWNTFIEWLTAGIFTGFVWSILTLWAKIFILINIHFFDDLFSNEYFSSFVSPIFFAVGLFYIYQSEKVAWELRSIVLKLCKVVLPLLSIFALLFIVVWIYRSTTLASIQLLNPHILFCVLILGIILINAVYQEGGLEKPYNSKIITTAVDTFIFTLPIFSLLALYTLWLFEKLAINYNKIAGATHSLNESFFSNFFIAFVLLFYSFAYAACAYRRSQFWLVSFGKTNVILGWLFVISVIIFNNPWFTNSPINPEGKNNPRLIKQKMLKAPILSASMTTADKLSAIDKNTLAADLRWQPMNKDTLSNDLIVMGYFKDTPIYACRTLVKEEIVPGELINGICTINFKNKIIQNTSYEGLVGNVTAIRWRNSIMYANPANSIPLYAGYEKNTLFTLCRVIYQNYIHIGHAEYGNCFITDNDKPVTLNYWPEVLLMSISNAK